VLAQLQRTVIGVCQVDPVFVAPSNVRLQPRQLETTAAVGCKPSLGGPIASMYIFVYTCDMPRQYSIAEARANLPDIVDQAEAGAEVELTRRGRPVAVVVSRRTFERLREKGRQFSDAYEGYLGRFSLDEIGLDPGDLTAARDTTSGRQVTL
jgi:prevent-host-death family protein